MAGWWLNKDMIDLNKTIRDLMAFCAKQRELQRLQIESKSDSRPQRYRSHVVDAYTQIITTLGSLGERDDANTKDGQGSK